MSTTTEIKTQDLIAAIRRMDDETQLGRLRDVVQNRLRLVKGDRAIETVSVLKPADNCLLADDNCYPTDAPRHKETEAAWQARMAMEIPC